MKLTNGVEQAICILVLLATQEGNSPLASDEISKKLDVSPSYTKKITRKLVVKNLINSVPGTKGGISLARSLDEISMLDIIEAMEGPIDIFPDSGLISKAFQEGLYAKKGEDLLRDLFHQADELLKEYFSKITAADMLKANFGTLNFPRIDWNNNASLSEIVNQKSGEKN